MCIFLNVMFAQGQVCIPCLCITVGSPLFATFVKMIIIMVVIKFSCISVVCCMNLSGLVTPPPPLQLRSNVKPPNEKDVYAKIRGIIQDKLVFNFTDLILLSDRWTVLDKPSLG